MMATLAVPAVLLLTYALLAGLVAWRRAVTRHESRLLILTLVATLVWLLLSARTALPTLIPTLDAARAAPYALLPLALLYLWFTRAFTLRPWLAWPAPMLAGLALTAALALDAGLIALPGLSAGWLLSFAAALLWAGAVLLALRDFQQRPNPLHRNRILYWLVATALFLAGLALVALNQPALELAGFTLNAFACGLLVYVLRQTHLLHLTTNLRRVFVYLISVTLPAAASAAVALAVVDILSQQPDVFLLRVDQNLRYGLLFAGIAAALIFWPLYRLTHGAIERLILGRRYGANRVARDYGQAVSRIMALPDLTLTAMNVIDAALGLQRGTLVLARQRPDNRWQLDVLPGLNVDAGLPPLLIDPDSPFARWLIDDEKPLNQYTIDIDPAFAALPPAHRAQWQALGLDLYVPINRAGFFVGLFALGPRRSGQPYSGADLDLLNTLASQTAVALENAALFDRVTRRANQLALLNDIGQVITAAIDLDVTLTRLTERIQSAFPHASGFIFLADDNPPLLRLQSTFGEQAATLETARFTVPFAKGLIGWVAERNQAVQVDHLPNDPRYDPGIEGVLLGGLHAALCVPVLVRGQSIGVILLAERDASQRGELDLNLLTAVAAFAANAIDNARRVAAREARLRREMDQLRIQIDEIQRAQQVDEITGTDYFRQLQQTARDIRRRRTEPTPPSSESALIDLAGEDAMFQNLQQTLAGLPAVEGITPADIMLLPDPLRSALNKIIRNTRLTLAELAAEVGLPETQTGQLADQLIEKGYLLRDSADDITAFRIHYKRKSRERVRKMPVDIWKAFDED